MGNKVSFQIDLENNGVATAGGTLRGNVIVMVTRQLGGSSAIHLIMTGSEETSLRCTSKGALLPHVAKQGRTVFATQQALRTAYSTWTVRPGRYVHPFSIALPATLPGSSCYPRNKMDSDSGFQINYTVKAIIGEDVKLRFVQVLSAPLPQEPAPCVTGPLSYTVSGMFGKKGSLTLGATLADSRVGKGSRLDLSLACRNDSTARIERVNIRLLETVEWRAEGSQRDKTLVLLSERDAEIPGIDRAGKRRKDVKRRLKQAESETIIRQSINDAQHSEENRITLSVPPSARDSYDGDLISVTHGLEIKLQTSTWSRADPTVVVPITIGNRLDRQHSVAEFVSEPMTLSSGEVSVPTLAYPTSSQTEQMGASSDAPANIPMVPAIVVQEEETSPSSSSGSDEPVIMLGAEAVLVETNELSTITPLPPPALCVSSLTRAMGSSGDRGLIHRRVQEAEWVRVFEGMTPEEYGSIVSHVHNDSDQTEVATMLAPYANHGKGMTCRYAAAAIRNASAWNRSNMAQRLVPMCTDVAQEHALIQQELNQWETAMTTRCVQDAIRNSARA